MRYLWLLLLCWFPSSVEMRGCIRVDGYLCVSSYRDDITCEVNITNDPEDQTNSTYSLRFTDSMKRVFTGPLVLKDHTYSCDCKVVSGTNWLRHGSRYTIQVCNGVCCRSLVDGFLPSQNIQLKPPHGVEVHQTPEVFNISWRSGYEDHRYLANYLEFELLLQQRSHSVIRTETWYKNFQLIPRGKTDNSPSTYCTKVRSIPAVKGYNATWSKWTPQLCWESGVREEQRDTITTSLGLAGAVAAVLLCAISIPVTRMKMKKLHRTPSPAPFFQTMFQRADGNLKEWFAPQGKYALTCKTDEILTTSAVTVVPKSMTGDLRDIVDFHPPSPTPLTFSLHPSSYVDVPKSHEDPHPVTPLCLEDSPYTQFPCPAWDFGTSDVQVESFSPQDFLETSCVDSGFSCEDLTQSPECGSPCEPIDVSSPPCYCTNYCILTKTDHGDVPVFVTC